MIQVLDPNPRFRRAPPPKKKRPQNDPLHNLQNYTVVPSSRVSAPVLNTPCGEEAPEVPIRPKGRRFQVPHIRLVESWFGFPFTHPSVQKSRLSGPRLFGKRRIPERNGEGTCRESVVDNPPPPVFTKPKTLFGGKY